MISVWIVCLNRFCTAALEASAKSLEEAVLAARELIAEEYLRLRSLEKVQRDESPDAKRWRGLKQWIRIV